MSEADLPATAGRLAAVARELDRRDELTPERASVLQQAADPRRTERYKCVHPEIAGAGWSHPWPDQPMVPHACCRQHEHCPAEWVR